MLFSVKRLLFFLCFVLGVLTLPTLAKRATQGFRIAKMQIQFPYHPEWQTPIQAEVIPILEQRFHYLGKGAQSYVFESADQKYVIKLFRYDHPQSEEKITLLMNACKMAYDRMREETGLVYIHLNPTKKALPVLHCKDALGRSYRLSLDNYRFALQKKASDFRKTLLEAKGDPKQMKERIDAFLQLLQVRTQRGIVNTDPNLSRNFGFLGDRAIELDFGNYRDCPTLNQKAEMERHAHRLRRWLKKNAPEWVAYLDAEKR
jgi:hypothetical protein